MVGHAFHDVHYWDALDKTMAHVVHAVARSSTHVVFKGGTHLRLCIVEIKHLPEFRYSEDLDFEWEDSEWMFWWRSPDPDMREMFTTCGFFPATAM